MDWHAELDKAAHHRDRLSVLARYYHYVRAEEAKAVGRNIFAGLNHLITECGGASNALDYLVRANRYTGDLIGTATRLKRYGRP